VEPGPSRSAATLDAVAARAGVSRATASRVLTGSSKVSERSRAAVQAAAGELSYVANPAARSLAKRRSDSIAFVVAESEDRVFTDPFFATVLRGVQGVLAERELQLLFVVVGNERDRERFVRFAGQGHIDGAILLSVHGQDPLPVRLRERGVRVVLSGRPHSSDADAVFVDADNRGGGRQAADLLLERGCHGSPRSPVRRTCRLPRTGSRASRRVWRRRGPRARACASSTATSRSPAGRPPWERSCDAALTSTASSRRTT
jgi:DNA-binding LacI/PurR family transcriptional regulator